MSYDSWKTTPDYMENKDVTKIEELEAARKHLVSGAQTLDAATKCAVLSRSRRARIDAIEQDIYDLVADLDEELSYR